MASEFAIIIAISISQKRKRSRGVCLGRFRGLSTGRAMHSLHSHSIGQNSVTWLHLIARKAVTYSQARYPRRRGHGFSSTHVGEAQESSQAQDCKAWGFDPGDPLQKPLDKFLIRKSESLVPAALYSTG